MTKSRFMRKSRFDLDRVAAIAGNTLATVVLPAPALLKI
jgi:hypothetical protein